MKDLYTALCSVSFYNVDGNLTKEYIVITGVENFQEATERAEAWYGKDLASLRITLYGDPYLTITESRYDELMGECL